jgi:SAM-dependent methyltransferase
MDQQLAEDSRLLSHEVNPHSLITAVEKIKQRITQAGDKPDVTVARQLQLVDELAQFPFGQFLLQHQGINGYWTHYMTTHPWHGRKTGLNPQGKPFTPLEKFVLDRAPTLLATQQRLMHFLRENQKAVKDGAKLACIPCGMMGELLYLDYSNISTIELYGFDRDPLTLQDARQLAQQKKLEQWIKLLERDAWHLNIHNELDLISSNGLNIYEPDDEKVIELYKGFHKALRADGVLVTSFLTLPPNYAEKCEWDMTKIEQEAALLQRIIFADILEAKCQCYRSAEQTTQQLKAAGFQNIHFYYDDAKIFPTVVARK